MPFEDDLAAYAARHGWLLDVARRRANAAIDGQVDLILAGGQDHISSLAPELQAEARDRLRRRRDAGDDKGTRAVASSGGRLA